MITSPRSIPRSAFRTPRFALWLMVAILLLAAAFRFLAVDSAPPGWRDDELIEYSLDRRIADGWRPLFIAEAEGHEPVYHYLHAGTIVLFGDNIIGYKWLPFACGLLSIALTYALARKMFRGEHETVIASAAKQAQPQKTEIASSRKDAPRNDVAVKIALLATALMAVSFWPIMYARFGVRHIGVLPWLLATFYLLYPSDVAAIASFDSAERARPEQNAMQSKAARSAPLRMLHVIFAGVCLAAALMTYFAGRAVPVILVGFSIYLAIFQRPIFKRVWWRYLLALGMAVLIALPMFIEIARTPGGEKRTEVVGGPLIELRRGNVQPAVETTLSTLGMFTFVGDPESLYNVPGRPVFDWTTGVFFYLGVLVCLIRFKRVESGFALVWLVVGIAPAFVSIPAASYSHTIAVLPVVYMMAAVGVLAIVDKYASRQGNKKLAVSTLLLVSLLVVGMGAYLTLRDYFGTWANDPFVRFQYHAPTREIAQWLDHNPDVVDVAIGTHPNELALDPLALKLDMPQDIPASWFNAESALAQSSTGWSILTAMRAPSAEVRQVLSDTAHLQEQQPGFEVYSIVPHIGPIPPSGGAFDQGRLKLLSIEGASLHAQPGDVLAWRTYWIVNRPVAQPRLKMFLHILNDKGEVVAGDDREDLNFATLGAGDSFWQINQLTLPNDLPPGPYPVELGWYNPEIGERLKRDDGSDRLLLAPLEVIAR